MAATGTSTHPSAPKPAPSAPDTEKSPFVRLAEAVARAQAHLNNPKTGKSSARREPVRLLPSDDLPRGSRPSLSRACLRGQAEAREPRQKQGVASPSSSLPQAAINKPARSAVGFARAPRVSSVRQAKNYLRSTRPPKFLNPHRSLDRHRRKCAICHHPEREMIEELFIHWHSPEVIANFLDDHDQVNWVSIYRHAYALGLDAIRRRNLGFVFENILDNAADAVPSAAGVVAAARAIGCIGEDGRWVEPEKRILMTTLVRKEDASATTSTDAETLQNSASKSDEIGREPFTSLPKAAVDQSVRSTGQFGSSATEHEPHDVPSSLLPQAALDIPAAASQTPHRGISVPASSPSREIRPPLNSHNIKEKRISNR